MARRISWRQSFTNPLSSTSSILLLFLLLVLFRPCLHGRRPRPTEFRRSARGRSIRDLSGWPMESIYCAMSFASAYRETADYRPDSTDDALPEGLSVVVPAYRSVATLSELVERLARVLPGLAKRHEVVIVDDGSGDGTWEVIQLLATKHRIVRGVNLMRNYGQHNAVLCGVRAARFDRVVTMDDDLQHPPEELPRLVAELRPGCDVVYGFPVEEQHGLFRNTASCVVKLGLQGAMGAETARMVSSWRIFRTRLRESFADYRGPFVSVDVLLTWGTSRFHAVRLRHEPRRVGRTNYTLRNLTRVALTMMTGFSVMPLRVASFVGFGFTLFGGGVLVYVVGRYLLSGTSVPGFPFLASIIAIFSGAQLFALGIIGEYLALIHFRTMHKPTYVVGERVGDGVEAG